MCIHKQCFEQKYEKKYNFSPGNYHFIAMKYCFILHGRVIVMLRNASFMLCCFFLFGLMLYVHGKQLRSCGDGQLSYPHCSWASLPQAGYQYLAYIISPLTDKCSS